MFKDNFITILQRLRFPGVADYELDSGVCEDAAKEIERLREILNKSITLSENVRQKSPVGFMVFAYEPIDVAYMVFPEEREARHYAMEQEEKANAAENSWPIYALWASEWSGLSD